MYIFGGYFRCEMDIRKRYSIAFKGLGEGRHEYAFELNDRFFEAFEGSEITGGRGVANIVLTKGPTVMEVEARIEAGVTVPCDRCLEDCVVAVDYEGGFKVRFGETEDDFDGELMWLSHGEGELPLAQYIYESIVLALPYRRVHPDGPDGRPGCSPEILNGVRLISEEEFSRAEQGSEMQRMKDNPEWQKLRDVVVND